ncbi:hypothetical protein K470DRAFT_254110 [Piedraia hortae CBS 480.64]|uniref:Uncharacterized protein n=1 Tax=Piedraia hortae CBS 480.64 TaxID=1314780 RepID=A0A6A7CAB5_9PEZI|nr:hypothetical protein K470DRAFT_254110 [Piedraia hortae CBS 480.64]
MSAATANFVSSTNDALSRKRGRAEDNQTDDAQDWSTDTFCFCVNESSPGGPETLARAHDQRQHHRPRAATRTPAAPVAPSVSVAGLAGLAFLVVAKLFTFGTNVVRGFYAGGGKGYDLSPLPPREFLGDFEQDNQEATPTKATDVGAETPLSSSKTPSRPPYKRRRSGRDSWVVPDESLLSPTRCGSIPTRSATLGRRSYTNRRSLRLSPSGGSRPLSPVHIQNHSYSHHSPVRRASVASTNSLGRSHSRAASAASAVFVTPEAERLVRRRAKQDRLADAQMTDMSRKLEELIRMGQQALGTKVEVCDDVDDYDENVEEGEEW